MLLDVLHEAGRSGGVHGTASVVDTTVRAAAAIAEHYLRQGDRVGLVEYSGHPRHLRAAERPPAPADRAGVAAAAPGPRAGAGRPAGVRPRPAPRSRTPRWSWC